MLHAPVVAIGANDTFAHSPCLTRSLPRLQALEFNPTPYHDQDDWNCRYGPCLNMCCLLLNDGSCADNLVANGGHYLPGETPMLMPACTVFA